MLITLLIVIGKGEVAGGSSLRQRIVRMVMNMRYATAADIVDSALMPLNVVT